MKSDIVFDGIANKFAANIYGTSKGQIRHRILCHAMSPFLVSPQHILEIGGGTGIMTKHLCELGHSVTLTDASEDVLTHARVLLEGVEHVRIEQSYLQEITDIGEYNMIVCHAVMEWLDAPFDAIHSLYKQMQKGALLSLSFFNHDANLFANALYGNFDYIAKGMKVKKQVKLNPKQPMSAKAVIEFCESIGFTVKAKTGVRCFHDYLKDREHQKTKFNELFALEKEYCQREPYLWLGKYFHVMLEK